MRIISGFLKGKRINYLKNSTTRPLKDSVKENIFNILEHSNLIQPRINKSNILDLYSGIGSFGIECISRGAKKVTFIEKNFSAIDILKKNLTDLSILNRSELICDSIESVLRKKFVEKFNILFFDPPFVDNSFTHNLKIIKTKNHFQKDHIIIVHRERKKTDDFNDLINILDVKEYGRSKVFFGTFN